MLETTKTDSGTVVPAVAHRSDMGCDDGVVRCQCRRRTSSPDVEERTTEIRENGVSFAPSRRWRLDTPRLLTPNGAENPLRMIMVRYVVSSKGGEHWPIEATQGMAGCPERDSRDMMFDSSYGNKISLHFDLIWAGVGYVP